MRIISLLFVLLIMMAMVYLWLRSLIRPSAGVLQYEQIQQELDVVEGQVEEYNQTIEDSQIGTEKVLRSL